MLTADDLQLMYDACQESAWQALGFTHAEHMAAYDRMLDELEAETGKGQ